MIYPVISGEVDYNKREEGYLARFSGLAAIFNNYKTWLGKKERIILVNKDECIFADVDLKKQKNPLDRFQNEILIIPTSYEFFLY